MVADIKLFDVSITLMLDDPLFETQILSPLESYSKLKGFEPTWIEFIIVFVFGSIIPT